MASERKRWLKCPESVAFDPALGRRDALLATWFRLRAYMNRRWARDGIEAAAAETIVLDGAALHQITNRAQRRHALAMLHALCEHAECSLRVRGEHVEIYWPNLAKSLWSRSAERVVTGPPNSEERDYEDPKKSKPRANAPNHAESDSIASLIAGMPNVPDRLSPEDRQLFSSWLSKHYPPLWNHRLRLERECLGHYRRFPDRAARVRSWLATCEGWAKRAWENEKAQPGLWPTAIRRNR